MGQLRNIDLQVASRTEADSVLPRYRGRGRFRNLAASCQARNRSSKLGFTGFTVQMDSHLQSSKHGQRIRLTLANELLHLVTRRSFGHFSSYFWRARHGSAVQPLLYSMQFLRFSSWIINRSVQYARDLGSTLKIVIRCSCFPLFPLNYICVYLCMFRIDRTHQLNTATCKKQLITNLQPGRNQCKVKVGPKALHNQSSPIAAKEYEIQEDAWMTNHPNIPATARKAFGAVTAAFQCSWNTPRSVWSYTLEPSWTLQDYVLHGNLITDLSPSSQ